MRTVWRIRYALLVFVSLACGAHTSHDPDSDQMEAVLLEMIRANSETSGDSLMIRRNSILKEHNTDEAEIRAWIARIGKNPEESQRVAQQLAVALEDQGKQPAYKKD